MSLTLRGVLVVGDHVSSPSPLDLSTFYLRGCVLNFRFESGTPARRPQEGLCTATESTTSGTRSTGAPPTGCPRCAHVLSVFPESSCPVFVCEGTGGSSETFGSPCSWQAQDMALPG